MKEGDLMPRVFWGLFLVLLLFAPSTQAGVAGSAHDFRSPEQGGPNTQYPALAKIAQGHPCRVCHTTHEAKKGEALFTEDYGWDTITRVTVPSSTLCLSCHDGQIITPEGTVAITDPNKIVSKRHRRHRVEKIYPLAQSSLPLRNTVVIDQNGRTWAVGENGLHLPLYTDPETGQTRMGCGTCHDPHQPGTTGYFLRGDSLVNLCQTCHQRGASSSQGR